MGEVVIEGLEVDIIEKIKITRSKNEEVVRVVEEIKKVEIKVLWGDELQIERVGIKGSEGVHAKEWSIEDEDHLVTS